MITAKIIKDSIAEHGRRLTTMELCYPRFIHQELLTHRDFSRNSASSRAIPVEKLLSRIESNPAIPVFWGKNKPGMSAIEEVENIDEAKRIWLEAKDSAISFARKLNQLGLHKQITNRIVEPFMMMTVIVTATNWNNFYHLRCANSAQPEIQLLANTIKEAYENSTPTLLKNGEWHLPYVDNPQDAETDKKISVARCARVSYLTHDGNIDIDKDIDLYNKLLTGGHWSPFEHVATPTNAGVRSGNFVGFIQYRKMFENEYYE